MESKDLMKLKSRDEMGHVFVGGLDTNDQEDAGAWGDGEYVDERTGLDLDPKLAKRARIEEIEYMKKIGLYDEADVSDCWTNTGRPPISTKWVDVNKGDEQYPNYR